MNAPLAFPKPEQRRSRIYIRWIRRQGCLVCRRHAQAHHTTHGGVGLKGSDFETVPLCEKHHVELHQIGQETFQQRYHLDFKAEIARFREKYSKHLLACGATKS